MKILLPHFITATPSENIIIRITALSAKNSLRQGSGNEKSKNSGKLLVVNG
jgi:hypothetical protein